MDSLNLNQALASTFKSLGYSHTLSNKAISDLEQVIAIRYYNRLASLLPKTIVYDMVEGDYEQVIKLAKENIEQTTLQDQILVIAKEVISEYLEELAK